MKQPKVYAVIVSYNPDLELFARQLSSLISQVDSIVVVDNASVNITEVKELIDYNVSFHKLEIHLIRNPSNFGLGKAQNKGISYSISNFASHVLILDQDSILDNSFVSGLLESESSLKAQGLKVAAVGPTYYNEHTGEVYPVTKYKGPFIERIKPTTQPVEATFLIASGCLISVEVLDKIGLMNEELFIDYVDVEWSFRAKSCGYSLYASPKSKMKHTIGDNRTSILGRTISVHSPLRRYYLYRNSIYMVKNPNIDIGYKVREITFNAIRFAVFLCLSSERKKYFKYSLAGFRDGFKGITGKCPHLYG